MSLLANHGLMGGGIDPDYLLYLNELQVEGVTISSTVTIAQNQFVKSLKGVGLFSRMQRGLFLHAGSANAAKVDLRYPTTKKNTLVGTLTFSEGNGLKSNGTTGYINQNFLSNEYSGIETNLTTIQYISESNTVAADIASSGFRTGVSFYTRLYPFRSLGFGGGSYGNLIDPFVVTGNHKGLIVCGNISGLAGLIGYKDGTKGSSTEAANAPIYSQNRFILALNNTAGTGSTPIQFYTRYVAIDFLFDRFSDADELNFRTIFNTYKTAVGLP